MLSFRNPGEIDPRTITTIGANIKIKDNPIGFFGTGLKYAIAIILRLGGKITIYSGLDKYTFSTKKVDIRGKSHDLIMMNDQELGFTMDYGKNWEPWMAFREIYSNCMDEEGEVSTTVETPKDLMTTIIVDCADFEKTYLNKGNFFLENNDHLIHTNRDVDVYSRPEGGVFYRGIRVASINSEFSYCIKIETKLTEDRTMKDDFNVRFYSAISLALMTDKDIIHRVLTAEQGTFEHRLDFDFGSVDMSKEFKEVALDLIGNGNARLNHSIKGLIERRTETSIDLNEAEISDLEQQQLTKAIEFSRFLGFNVDYYPIKIAKDLGMGIHGLAKNRIIYIDEECFKIGTKYLASTLIEEFIHIRKGFKDETRSMQNYLFETIVHLGERLKGEPI
jgi:hypothetical protein